MKKERLIAFTDAILAIIMTILVLDLDKPSEPSLQAFWSLRTSFFSYTLSFFWLGSMWVALNSIWEKAEKINNNVVWWNLFLLFLASLIPYATSLCGNYFDNRVIQAFYGIVVIVMTACNYALHGSLAKADKDNTELQEAVKAYQEMLLPDIFLKILALVLSLVFYPPIMMYGVLISAAYVLTRKYRYEKKTKHSL